MLYVLKHINFSYTSYIHVIKINYNNDFKTKKIKVPFK